MVFLEVWKVGNSEVSGGVKGFRLKGKGYPTCLFVERRAYLPYPMCFWCVLIRDMLLGYGCPVAAKLLYEVGGAALLLPVGSKCE